MTLHVVPLALEWTAFTTFGSASAMNSLHQRGNLGVTHRS